MNHKRKSTFAFPSGFSDRDAAAFCDFLFQLAAAADAHYLGQVLRYQRSIRTPPQNPSKPWRTGTKDF